MTLDLKGRKKIGQHTTNALELQILRAVVSGCHSGCGMLNGLVIPPLEVVFPPQSTYWYISCDTCSAWLKYVVVAVTLGSEGEKKGTSTDSPRHFQSWN